MIEMRQVRIACKTDGTFLYQVERRIPVLGEGREEVTQEDPVCPTCRDQHARFLDLIRNAVKITPLIIDDKHQIHETNGGSA